MHELKERVSVSADLDQVWNAIVGFSERAKFSSRVQQAEVEGGQPLAVGSRIKLRVDGRTFRPVVETLEPPSRLVLRISGPAFRALHSYEAHSADGGTALVLRGAYGGVLGGVLARMMSGSFRRDLAEEALAIKAAAEVSA